MALLAGFIVILISAATIATAHYHQEAIGGILLSKVALYHLVLPFLIWMILISFLTVVQHTHPQARWRMASGSPSTTRDQADGTIHVVFPEWLDLVFHRVMHHHAHHLQPAIPVYHLKFAQSHLAGAAASEGTPFITARWSFRHHFDVAARCKLFDVENDCWRDFTGRVTGQPPIQGAL